MLMLESFVVLFMEAAPWLIVGFIVAGLIKTFLPMSWLREQLGQEGFSSVFKASIFGIPLPLCSCGVIPAAIGLRRQGASKSATTAFMVSTPETGVDSISISYALLGPFLASMRPIAAFFSAMVAGLLVGKEDAKHQAQMQSEQTSSCCSKKHSDHDSQQPLTQRLQQSAKYVSFDMVEDTVVWLLTGLLFAALVKAYVPEDFLVEWGHGLLGMLLMMVISVPMYICATASTPIAAGLLLAGVSPGAVLLFMLAGPATNIATLSVVAKELGQRSLIAYLTGVLGVALLFGFLTDYLVSAFAIDIRTHLTASHEMLPDWIVISSSVLLALFMSRALLVKLKLHFVKLAYK